MPIKNGIKATQEIMQMYSDNKYPIKPNIVAHTAYNDSETKDRCL